MVTVVTGAGGRDFNVFAAMCERTCSEKSLLRRRTYIADMSSRMM